MSDIFIYALIIVAATFISSISQILLKISATKTYENRVQEYLNPWVMMGYGLFFGCTLINVFALKYIPLSLMPILESTGYIFVTVLGYFILKEKIGKKKLLGMLIILVGIFVFSI